MIEKHMCDNLLLIVPTNIKTNLIEEISSLNTFYSYKIIDDSELKKLVCFDYDIRAIVYLSEKYNIKYDIAKEYLELMIFLTNTSYQSKKLNDLLMMKNDLISHNLLIINHNCQRNFHNKTIKVYGFDVITKKLKFLLDLMKTPYEIITPKSNYNEGINKIYHFDTLSSQIDSLCYQISTLLKNNVDINKIKLANVTNEMIFTLKNYFSMYNIPLQIKDNTPLIHYLCVKDFVDDFNKNSDLITSLSYFKDKYPYEDEIYNDLFNIANQLVLLDESTRFQALLYLLNNKSKSEKSFQNVIKVIDINNYNIKDEYVFVLGVNQGIFPLSYKDDDLLSNIEKNELNIDTSNDLNILEKEKFNVLIHKSKNITLSYYDKSFFQSYLKSFILNEFDIKDETFNKDVLHSFSKLSDKLNLAKACDRLYQQSDDYSLSVLASNYDILYKSYDHRYKQINPKLILNYIEENKINLSYSSLDNFYSCSFKYYMANLLKLNSSNQDKYYQNLGNTIHAILENSTKKDFDIDNAFKEAILNALDEKSKFYLSKYKEITSKALAFNENAMQLSDLKNIYTEKNITIYKDDEMKMNFTGFIDKILYFNNDDKSYVALIDYKSKKNETINLDKVEFGLSMQLPIYLYLIRKSKLFINPIVCGIYLQMVYPYINKYGEEYDSLITNSLKWQGYSSSSLSNLARLDYDFENSSFIASLKLKKDGNFASHSKVLSDDEMDKLYNLVDDKIKSASKEITNGHFAINPKVYESEKSCDKCEFHDCCFKDHNDFIYLKKEKGGDDNGN